MAMGAGLVVLLFLGVWLGAFVYWIVALVEVIRIPDQQFRAAGTEKAMWIIVVALLQIVGALVWLFAKRSDVLAAAGRIPAPAPGWYPEPGGGLRWWNGTGWTDDRHTPPPIGNPPLS